MNVIKTYPLDNGFHRFENISNDFSLFSCIIKIADLHKNDEYLRKSRGDEMVPCEAIKLATI